MPTKKTPSVSEQLRKALKDSGQTTSELQDATGVDRSVLSRFMRGERGMTTPSLDSLCAHLGLRLTRARK